jgi:L-alanine-DL-glutamate epimerase-like enolase superfamily enzyme
MIESLEPILIGQDLRRYEATSAWLYARGRTAQGGITQQAIAAIEYARIDIVAQPADHDAAQRPHHEAHSEGGERRQP